MKIEDFWQGFVTAYPKAKDEKYEAWGFGDSDQLADELAGLVLAGIKTGTCSAKRLYALDNEPMPKVGEYSVILDGQGEPRCVIVTTKLVELPFKEVGAEFAASEGEDDRTLASWRREHLRYFKRAFAEYDLEFNEDEILVCENFEVVYPVK